MDNDQTPQMDFHNTDGVMMLLCYQAVQLIDKTWSIERQAETLAQFEAAFMNIRTAHESKHTATPSTVCPFCAALTLSASLNRKVEE